MDIITDETRKQYLTNMNVNALMQMRQFKAFLLLAITADELTPATRTNLKNELIGAAAMVEVPE